MPSKFDDAMAALAAERDRVEGELGRLNAAIDALRGVMETSAAPARRRPGRPRKNAAAPAPRAGRPRKAAVRKPRKARAAKKPAAPKLEPRIEEYFAADPTRESTALEIGEALGADHRAVRLSLGRMAKKDKATKLEGGLYRAYSA
jgi:hypothetical protein